MVIEMWKIRCNWEMNIPRELCESFALKSLNFLLKVSFLLSFSSNKSEPIYGTDWNVLSPSDSSVEILSFGLVSVEVGDPLGLNPSRSELLICAWDPLVDVQRWLSGSLRDTSLALGRGGGESPEMSEAWILTTVQRRTSVEAISFITGIHWEAILSALRSKLFWRLVAIDSEVRPTVNNYSFAGSLTAGFDGVHTRDSPNDWLKWW